MSTLVGFMVGVRMVFGVVVSPVFRTSVTVITKKWSWNAWQQSHQKRMSIILAKWGAVSFVTPVVVDYPFG
jgi:hypothetical protein